MFNEYQEFLFDCQMRKLSPRTIKSYRNMTKAFLNYTKEEYNISEVEDIKKKHIQSYLKMKMDAGRKDKYINSILKVIRAFFAYLEGEEYICKNPADRVKFIREEKKIIEVFTDEEIVNLISAYSNVDYLSVRNKMILAIQLDTGIRCTETLDIRFNDLLGDRILIHGKGNKQRLVGISPPINRLLKQYKRSYNIFFESKEVKDENLFLSRSGRRLTVEMIERIYKKAQLIANITRDIRVSPHTSRHTYGSKMIDGNDIYTVSKLMGHSSVKITEVYLTSVTNEKLLNKGAIRSPLQTIKSRKY